jgi:acyl-CoA synthetase (AMP-forming)/AMP-acid ligase II
MKLAVLSSILSSKYPNGKNVSFKDFSTLQTALRATLTESPQQRALAFYSLHGSYWLTREEVEARAARLAARFKAEGLKPGDVAILVLNSGEPAALSLLAVLMAGGVPLLIAPPVIQGTNSSLFEILDGVIRRTGTALVLADTSMTALRDSLERGHPETRFLWISDELPATEPAEPHWHEPSPEDIAALQLTSGTTAFPRICVWKQKSVMASLAGIDAAMGLEDSDIFCNWTPLYHDMGLVNNFFLCMARGLPLVMIRPIEFVKRPALWLQALSDTGATVTWSPNFGFALAAQRIRDEWVEGVRLDHVHSFWNAAERIHLGTMQAFQRRFAGLGLKDDALRTNFGCVENVGGATFSDRHRPFAVEWIDRRALHEEQVARQVPTPATSLENGSKSVVGVGRPCPGVNVHILSPTGESLGDGHVGEIAFRSESRMEGYLGDQEATAQAFSDDLLVTGDLGYLRDEEVFWVGRRDERITIRGKKLDPSELEWTMLHIDGLRAGCFVAFGVEDETIGTQRLVVVSEIREDLESSLDELVFAVRRKLFSDLGVHAHEVVLVQPGSLAKTSSGKRRHRHFHSLYLANGLQEIAVPSEVYQTTPPQAEEA